MAWMNLDQGQTEQLAMIGIFWAFSAPFLLLGMWASPGIRLAELGLALLISAAVGGVLALMLLLFLNDPSFLRLMPPDQKLPQFKFAPVTGLISVVATGTAGWLLYRRRAKD